MILTLDLLILFPYAYELCVVVHDVVRKMSMYEYDYLYDIPVDCTVYTVRIRTFRVKRVNDVSIPF